MRRTWKWVLAVGVIAVLLAGLQLWIHHTAAAAGESASRRFGAPPVEALGLLVACENCPLAERNRAVWALGEMEDRGALSVLRHYRTGAPCDHAAGLCQYELEKAIRKIEGTWGLRASLKLN